MGWFCPPLPSEVSTTKPGNSSASLPRPYVSHAPMLGRPGMVEPVLKKQCAGSWLIASVVIERMNAMSSATEPMSGNSSQISAPHWPNFLKPHCGPKQFSGLPCNCASCCPAVMLSGIGLPCISASFGLWSNVSRCDGPPAIVSQITRFAFGGKCGAAKMPRHFCSARSEPGFSSDPSATAPMPRAALPRKVRRVRWVRQGSMRERREVISAQCSAEAPRAQVREISDHIPI